MTDRTSPVGVEQIRRIADEVGLPEVGVTDASAFPELVRVLAAYEERGRTGFESGDIEERITPGRLLEGAKSIIVALLPYRTPRGAAVARMHPTTSEYGITSVYTYGVDYHLVLRQRLEALRDRLGETVGDSIRSRVAIDTSPLVDRRVAQRAGVGWIGKNGMLYSHRYGSYVFIGALITDFEIHGARVESMAVGEQCGTCVKCLVACPTGAIVAPGVIDATRCLSYVTQMKGMIPLEFRKALGRRIWGCDVCQTSCPENRTADVSDIDAFHPTIELAYPDLIEMLALSNRQFERKYGQTAMGWRGLRTLQRNALIVLGNIGSPKALTYIEPFLRHARVELRASAAWACGEIGGAMAESMLLEALGCEENEQVKDELERGLRRCAESRDR